MAGGQDTNSKAQVDPGESLKDGAQKNQDAGAALAVAAVPGTPKGRRQAVHDALLDVSSELSPDRNEANGSGNSEIDEALLDQVSGGFAFRVGGTRD